MKLSLVVPCFNEEENVEQFHDAVLKSFSDLKWEYEIVFVNDGSKDGTMKKLRRLNQTGNANVKVVSLSRNFGKESAVYAGMKESSGDYVTIIDADLQQSPDVVVQMVKMLDDNSELDCVTAYQKERKESFFIKKSKKIFCKIMNLLTEVEMKDGASDFRTMRRNMVNAVLEVQEYYRFSKGIFPWVGFNNVYIPYEVCERAGGSSKWGFRKLFNYAMDGLISFSTAPLRVATVIGSVSAVLAVIYMIVVVIQKLAFDIAVPGYATIVVLILLFGGLQLFGLGIIGEYIGRTYVEAKKRPIYIAKEIIEYKNKEGADDNEQ